MAMQRIIGGINIEAGDYGVCGCDRCAARRANEAEAARRVDDFGDSWSHTDMADNFPRLYRTARDIKPDLWFFDCHFPGDPGRRHPGPAAHHRGHGPTTHVPAGEGRVGRAGQEVLRADGVAQLGINCQAPDQNNPVQQYETSSAVAR